MDGVGMVSLSQLVHHPSYTAGPSCGEGSDPEKVFFKWFGSLVCYVHIHIIGMEYVYIKKQMYIYIDIIYTHPKIWSVYLLMQIHTNIHDSNGYLFYIDRIGLEIINPYRRETNVKRKSFIPIWHQMTLIPIGSKGLVYLPTQTP